MKPKILIVDDESYITKIVSDMFTMEDFQTRCAYNGKEALSLCRNEVFDIIICDVLMPKIDGLQFLQMIKQEQLTPSVIMMTAHSSIDTAVKAIKMGAIDYFLKPLDSDRLIHSVKKELQMRDLKHKVGLLRYQILDKYKLDNIIGKSPKMRIIFEKILRVAATDSTVLIQGETGTGKELVAAAIHSHSSRNNEAFVCVNVGGLTESILESELFGHVKGAFTGALYDKKGKFELAHRGTVFLDEIGDLSPAMQVKLLRVLQERKFERVGGTNTIHVDIRIIAATNKDLLKEVENNRFRSDLYYRLNIFPVNIPPLCERKEDIALLAAHFLKSLQSVTNKKIKNISSGALDKIMRHSWPGNVRELENIIERGMITEKGDTLNDVDIPETNSIMPTGESRSAKDKDIPTQTLSEYLNTCEKDYLCALLIQNRGAVGKAASMAGINPNTLYKKLKHLNLRKEDFKYKPPVQKTL